MMNENTSESHAHSESEDEISLFDLLVVLLNHKLLLVLLPLAVGVVALGISFLIRPVYTASAQILPPQQQQGSGLAALLGGSGGGLGAALGAVSGLKNPSDQWVGFLKSRVISDALVDRFKLQVEYESQYRTQARDNLGRNSNISAGKDGLIDIEVTDHDPKRAAQIANAYIEELQKLMKTLAVTEASQRRLFFEKQLKDAKDNLVRAETELKQTGVSADVMKTSPEAAVTKVAQNQAAIAALEVKVSVMKGGLTDRSPELQQALAELAALRGQLRLAEQTLPAGQSGGSEYVSRYREFKYYETLFEMLARQFELARSDEARDGALIQVVDPAQIPEIKSGPRRAQIALVATAVSFVLLVIFVLMRQGFRNFGTTAEGREKLNQLRRAWWRSRAVRST